MSCRFVFHFYKHGPLVTCRNAHLAQNKALVVHNFTVKPPSKARALLLCFSASHHAALKAMHVAKIYLSAKENNVLHPSRYLY